MLRDHHQKDKGKKQNLNSGWPCVGELGSEAGEQGWEEDRFTGQE